MFFDQKLKKTPKTNKARMQALWAHMRALAFSLALFYS